MRDETVIIGTNGNISEQSGLMMMNGIKRPLLAGLIGAVLLIAPPLHAAAQTLASGEWVNKSYDIHGGWEIVKRGGSHYIVFDEHFKTRSGPDLNVYLSPRPLGALSDNTVAPHSVKIAPLKSPFGAQEYEIPASLDLTEYRSLLIHCKTFSHLWGGATIAP